MRSHHRFTTVAAAIFLAYASGAVAQQSPVSTPPVSLQGSHTPLGNDSTLNCNSSCAISGVGDSSVTIGSADPGPGDPPPPPPLNPCVPGVIGTATQTINRCPAGSLAYNTNTNTVRQTRQHIRACPAGPTGAAVDTWGPWTPNAAIGDGCGYPSGKAVQIGVNNQMTMWNSVDGSTGSYPMGSKGGNPGGPFAQFSGTWTWNGQTKFVQVTCHGSESCTNYLIEAIGGAHWRFSVTGDALAKGDCMVHFGQPPHCSLNGHGNVIGN